MVWLGSGSRIGVGCIWLSLELERRLISMTISKAISNPGIKASDATNQLLANN